jgi:hypothetical protein
MQEKLFITPIKINPVSNFSIADLKEMTVPVKEKWNWIIFLKKTIDWTIILGIISLWLIYYFLF